MMHSPNARTGRPCIALILLARPQASTWACSPVRRRPHEPDPFPHPLCGRHKWMDPYVVTMDVNSWNFLHASDFAIGLIWLCCFHDFFSVFRQSDCVIIYEFCDTNRTDSNCCEGMICYDTHPKGIGKLCIPDRCKDAGTTCSSDKGDDACCEGLVCITVLGKGFCQYRELED